MPLMSESLKWLGFPNYIAYSNGSVYSIDKDLFLKPIIASTGYCKITLYYKGSHRIFSLHRVIYFSFRKNDRHYFNDGCYEVHHINEDKNDNKLSNLRMLYYYDHLTKAHYKQLVEQQNYITSLSKSITGFHIKCLSGLNKGKIFKSKAGLYRFLKQRPKKLYYIQLNQTVEVNGIKYKRIK